MAVVTTTMRYNQALADYVRQKMGDRSQRQVAARAGVSQTTIGNILLGRVPSPDVLEAVARAIGADPVEMDNVAHGRPTDPVERVEFALSGVDHLEQWQAEHLVRIIKQLAEPREEEPKQ